MGLYRYWLPTAATIRADEGCDSARFAEFALERMREAAEEWAEHHGEQVREEARLDNPYDPNTRIEVDGPWRPARESLEEAISEAWGDAIQYHAPVEDEDVA